MIMLSKVMNLLVLLQIMQFFIIRFVKRKVIKTTSIKFIYIKKTL